MATHILGLSAYYHDSAAALVRNGEIVAAAQEERFTRIKHDSAFPFHAVDYCLREGGIEPAQLDHVVSYDKPLLKFDRLLKTYLTCVPAGLQSCMHAVPLWVKTKLRRSREIRKSLDGYHRRLAFTALHEAHAASAFYPSPFEEAAVLTMDGAAEWSTASISCGRGNRLELLKTLSFPHSLGLLYSAFTDFCGFRVNSGEYDLMGLAPYGEPRFAGTIRKQLIDLQEDGSFRINMRYFRHAHGLTMTGPEFNRLFDGPPRRPESQITQREMDLAASVQNVTEEVVLRIARTARELTGSRNLCLAGDAALNCIANGLLLREGIFDDLWIQPAAGDAGGALGTALFVQYHLLEQARTVRTENSMQGALLGPRFSDTEIQELLNSRSIPYKYFSAERDLLSCVARALAEGEVVGWFQGRMEFGPRALGGRSILGDARDPKMQAQMNLRVKSRESFHTFASAVLLEDCPHVFDLQRASPYMLFVAPVREELRRPLNAEEQAAERDPDLIRRVNIPRSSIPAVTHVDYSARIQTVDERNGRFHKLLREFKRQTGSSVLINTSFNIPDDPIVCTPDDALRCFLAIDMDMLVLENCVVHKRDQSVVSMGPSQRAGHLAKSQLD